MVFKVRHSIGDRLYRRRKRPFEFCWEVEISGKRKEESAIILKESFLITTVSNDGPITVLEIRIDRSNTARPKAEIYFPPPSLVGRDFLSVIQNGPSQRKESVFKRAYAGLMANLKESRKLSDRTFFSHLARLDSRLRALHSAFLELNEYNISPDAARLSTEQLPFAEMLPNGQNLSEVIFTLETKAYHRIADSKLYDDYYLNSATNRRLYLYRDEYLSEKLFRRRRPNLEVRNALGNINRELGAAVKPIVSVGAQIDQTNGKRFVVFRTERDVFYPEEISDGTIKWLCILVSLYIPFSRIYLLEEPENFLHPWMQQRLIDIMRKQSEISRTIFLLTTHSSTILNAATPNEVIIVSATKRGTTTRSIRDKVEIESMLAGTQFGLGDLWVSGAIGGVPGEDD
jgi:hypothetical protein